MAFVEDMGIEFTQATTDYAEAYMEIEERKLQPYGYLHGGVTLALLETVASAVTGLNADLETELPFGVEMNARHKKPGRKGKIRAVAECVGREQSEFTPARKIICSIKAYDEEGDVITEGTFMSKIVPKAYLAEKWGISESEL